MFNKHTLDSFLDKLILGRYYEFGFTNINILYSDIAYHYSFIDPAINYSIRSFYFFKFVYFLRFNGLNVAASLKIFNMELENFWFFFLHNYNIDGYVSLCLFLFNSYFKSYNSKYLEVKTSRYTIRPSSFLVYNNLKLNSNRSWSNTWNIYKNFLTNKKGLPFIDIFRKLRQPRFWTLQFNSSCDSNFSSSFIFSFLRVQRRYNKRRYSKVRAYSRAPFFSGISLSSLLVSSFFNSNIKNVDWASSLPVIIDVNFVLFMLLVYFFCRLYKISKILPFLRQRGRIHVSKAFSRVSSTDLLLSWFHRFIK